MLRFGIIVLSQGTVNNSCEDGLKTVGVSKMIVAIVVFLVGLLLLVYSCIVAGHKADKCADALWEKELKKRELTEQ